jgi:arginyl-tRNA synthetase
VIPGDLGRELGLRACGTWRPPPAEVGGPGTYATSLPFRLAAETGREPGEVAAGLAARLLPVAWAQAASVTGGGYLTVTVTPAALAALATRVPAAGDACASSGALSGTCLEAPSAADPASAANWTDAWRLVTAAVTGRLAAAAGATVKLPGNTERSSSPDVAAARYAARGAEPPSPGPSSPASAVAAAGAEAVRYALARSHVPPAGPIDPRWCVRNTLDNPYFVVRYAHAHAASVLRWAADLGISRGGPGEFRPELLAQPEEQELLGAISWLPERVAAAARRRRPGAFIRDLESLAGTWLGCSENCPALPFGGRSAPGEESAMAARLWLAAAAQTALAAGLRLAGVAPPQRL